MPDCRGEFTGADRRKLSAAQMMHLIQRAVEQAFRLPCRYSYRHSPKNVGTDADVAT
jgi:hypothetical protein